MGNVVRGRRSVDLRLDETTGGDANRRADVVKKRRIEVVVVVEERGRYQRGNCRVGGVGSEQAKDAAKIDTCYDSMFLYRVRSRVDIYVPK